jgi:putative membrane protein
MLFQKKSNHIITFVQGIALGIAEIIPGVSGSTVALLMGIYDDFIDLLYQGSELVKVFLLFIVGKKKWKAVHQQFISIPWKFGSALGLGMISAIIGLSNIIIYLLVNFPSHLFAFLFGLTVPTMMIVWGQIKKKNQTSLLIILFTAAALFTLFSFAGTSLKTTNPHPLHLFTGGMVGISAMVLPGVSGSFMLLVLGLYNFVVGLISDVSHGEVTTEAVTQLGILISGMAVGFLTTVRVVKYAFAKARDQIMSFIMGLLVASWFVLWPFLEVIGIDSHGEPLLQKVSPLDLPPFISVQLVLIATLTAFGVYYLQAWADTHDATPRKKDAGISKI